MARHGTPALRALGACGALLLWLMVAPALAWTQDVLIMRPIGNAAAEVSAPEIVFEVEISAFSPVREVRINGEPAPVAAADVVRASRPLRLNPGTNRVTVTVTTDTTTASREFTILFRAEEAAAQAKPEQRPEQFVGLVGAQYATNPALLNSGGESGFKLFAIGIPRYDLALEGGDTARFQAIASREMYTADKFEFLELQFTQLSAEWIRPLAGGDDSWSLGGGLNSIDAGFKNPLRGKELVQDDRFVFGTLKRAQGEGAFTEYYGEFKDQDVAAPTGDFDADSTLLTFRATRQGPWNDYDTVLRGWLTLDNAEGKYEQKKIVRISAEAKAPLPRVMPVDVESQLARAIVGAGARVRLRLFDESNPLTGSKPQDTLITLLATALYPLAPSWVALGELALDNQSSNVDAAKYTNISLTMSLIYAY